MYGWRPCLLTLTLVAGSLHGAERVFDFSPTAAGHAPKDFRSTVSGAGPAGEWQVLFEDTAGAGSSVASQRAVLAQVSQDPTDERFPLLIFEPDVYRDFTLSARFRTMGGAAEQMAGLAFRIRDERNYYVVRASSRAGTFVFYKFVDGLRSAPIGVPVDIPTNTWHELSVECRGNQIQCRFNGRELLPVLTDNSFAEGRIGFWTKSDSVSHFADARITYSPQQILAKTLLREILEKYPRLQGVKICAPSGSDAALRIVASSDPAEEGALAGDTERNVVDRDVMYYGRTNGVAEVSLPIRDRNGDPVAAVRVMLKSFPGQTEANALTRARPVADHVQSRVRTARDLAE